MGDPTYIYRPMSEERKARLRKIHRARFAREGFRCVYGVEVPEHWYPIVQREAARFRHSKKRGNSIAKTREYIRHFLKTLDEIVEATYVKPMRQTTTTTT